MYGKLIPPAVDLEFDEEEDILEFATCDTPDEKCYRYISLNQADQRVNDERAKWQASRAAPGDGERAAEDTAAAWKVANNWQREADDNARQWAGCEARQAPLVELLREARDWLQHGRDRTAAMDALIARIDAALKEAP